MNYTTGYNKATPLRQSQQPGDCRVVNGDRFKFLNSNIRPPVEFHFAGHKRHKKPEHTPRTVNCEAVQYNAEPSQQRRGTDEG